MIEIIDALLARPELDPHGENASRLRALRARLAGGSYLMPHHMRFVNQCLAALDNIECAALDGHARCTYPLCPERGRACPFVESERRFSTCDYYMRGTK